MHELPVTESIVRIVDEEAKKHNSKKVNKILLKVGELSGLVPDCLQSYFDIASKGTLAEGAELKILKIPVTMGCLECGFEVELKDLEDNICPNCSKSNLKIIHGNEFYIESMEVDDDGNSSC